ncbi:hypothetical protein C3942_00685 [Solimonas fluminis]|uniref:Uncharacterized protein n=1 Tax=Solimonas fluminis TaxID=2086571 RepID=A0A2S5TKE4_9GAMM|nr:hypothetical protein [Solimonas fluminis]PPE75444.1 hypothetical protein C3942_00685 [Solimonas fluminis]
MQHTRSIIVFGPPGCGKTRDRKRIAKHYRLTRIRDNWDPTQVFTSVDTLHLTNAPPPGDGRDRRVISYQDAMFQVEAGEARARARS